MTPDMDVKPHAALVAVDRLHQEFTALTSAVSVAAEPSLAVTANDVFRKA